jgi:MFS family permease
LARLIAVWPDPTSPAHLIPAKYRGRIDIIVNGSFWLGAAAGSGASLLFLDPHLVPINVGWRLGFAVGGCLGLCILLLRRYVPESPRWLVTHGYQQKAEDTMADIERRVSEQSGRQLTRPEGSLNVHPRKSFGFALIARAMLGEYRGRSGLALALMVAQAFLFNAVFFSYGLVLTTFYRIPEGRTGLHLVALAISNFLGPLLLGQLFDTVGRRIMITLTYGLGGVLLIAAALAFGLNLFSAWTQTFAWMAIFFFASAVASSAYLTASEFRWRPGPLQSPSFTQSAPHLAASLHRCCLATFSEKNRIGGLPAVMQSLRYSCLSQR